MYASYQRRCFAYLIDSICIWILLAIASSIFPMFINSKIVATACSSLFISICSIINWCILESSSWQASIGKKLLGIKVTDINGQRITFWRACYKNCIFVFCSFGIIVYFFTPRKQCLHDLLASVCIIHQNSQLEDRQSILFGIKPSIIIIWILCLLLPLGYVMYKSISY